MMVSLIYQNMETTVVTVTTFLEVRVNNLLSQLKFQGLPRPALHQLFMALLSTKSHMPYQPLQANLLLMTGTGLTLFQERHCAEV